MYISEHIKPMSQAYRNYECGANVRGQKCPIDTANIRLPQLEVETQSIDDNTTPADPMPTK